MPSPSRWRFGPFEVDALEHQMRREGELVPVTRKSFALLATLLSRPGKLFTKAELFEVVWAGTVVTDAALSRAIRELRVALGDDATAPRYIATAHGLGFRFVALVSIDRAIADPAARSAALDQRFVGRDSELALLGEALAGARAGRRQTVFVTGEAGIGKTTLVDAFLRRPEVRGDVRMSQGRCVEQYGTGEAYLPILEALENLAHEVGSDRMREVLLRYAPAWLAQLPWLAHDADAESLRRATSEGGAQRMLREIAQALEVLAVERPIVLWLEDLHWSDPSTLAVIAFLAGRREPARLLLIGSFRPADAQAGAASLHGLALQLAQRGQALPLALSLLDEAAVGRYLGARFGDATQLPFASFAAFLHRRTDGNALFTVAMVDDLVRSGVVAEVAGEWKLTRSLTDLRDSMPDDLRHLVHDQIERLGEADRRLIEAAAVAGTDFSVAMLVAALRTDIGETEDRCLHLAQQGRLLRVRDAVTWPDGTASSGFSFLHALYRQGAYERVPIGRRAEWHGAIGLRQEQAFGSHCAPIAAELAMRFEVARDFERSLRYIDRAAANALACGAYVEGVELLRRGVALLPRISQDKRCRRELELLLPLGAASMAAQGYASTGVESIYQRALVLCRQCGQPGELVRVLRGLWNVVFLQADLVRAQHAAEELLTLAGTGVDTSLAFDALIKLGQTCMHRGEMSEARRHLEHALSLPASEDDSIRRREAPRATAYLAWVLWYTGHPEQALIRGGEALALSRQAKSPHSRAFALGFVSWLHMFCGDMARAAALALEQQAVSIEHGLLYWRTWADFTLGLAKASAGDRQQGTATMSAALEEMRSTGAEVGIVHFLCLLAEAELDAANPSRSNAALADAQALLAGNGNAQHAAEVERLLANCALAKGGGALRDEARRRFDRAIAIARVQGARGLELRAAVDLASMLAADGQAAPAAEALSGLYASFEEGLDTADLVRARRLLVALTAPDQVKASAGMVVPPPK